MNKIYLGDCLDILPHIENDSIDFVLCDLPYGSTRNSWDSHIPLDRLWLELYRVAKQSAAIAMMADFRFGALLIESKRSDYRYDLVYAKSRATGFLNANKMPLRSHEHVLIFYRSLPTYNPQMRSGFPSSSRTVRGAASDNYGQCEKSPEWSTDGDRHPTSVLHVNSVDQSNSKHPTGKPVALFEWLIRAYTNPGDTVLDPAMGSGTTPVACIRTGRQYVGIEKNEKYFDIAGSRINDTQPALFTEEGNV